jgi:hypothetical protein
MTKASDEEHNASQPPARGEADNQEISPELSRTVQKGDRLEHQMSSTTPTTNHQPEARPFVVVLRAEGAGPPAVVRLRRWLKAALRQHGLRCVSVAEGPAAGQGPTEASEPPARPTKDSQ